MYVAQTGATVYSSGVYCFSPQIVCHYFNRMHGANVLLSNEFHFENDNPYDLIKTGSVKLIGKFGLMREVGFGLVIHQPFLSFGFSYNVPLNSQGSTYFSNAVELSVKVSGLLRKPAKTKIGIGNHTEADKRSLKFQENETRKTLVEKSDAELIESKLKEHSHAKVASVQYELDKDFKFAFGRTDLNPEAKEYLDDLYALLQKNSEYNIEVIGHTDNVGKPMVNYKLSAARAEAVADYLIQKGLPKDRVRSKGMGDTQPLAPNDSEENKRKNRRVQFVIYTKR
jgi:outer membrane protein OmpA-like peptidoglycan-associated protein